MAECKSGQHYVEQPERDEGTDYDLLIPVTLADLLKLDHGNLLHPFETKVPRAHIGGCVFPHDRVGRPLTRIFSGEIVRARPTFSE
jgi:hypothetical protein